jgi:hypothetical protein
MPVFSRKTFEEREHIIEYAKKCAKIFENIDFETHNKQLVIQNGRLAHSLSGPLYMQFFNDKEVKL